MKNSPRNFQYSAIKISFYKERKSYKSWAGLSLGPISTKAINLKGLIFSEDKIQQSKLPSSNLPFVGLNFTADKKRKERSFDI